MNTDEMKYVIKNLMHRRMRSWLTILSVFMGIMAIFALVSFGLGIQNYMNIMAEEMGSDTLYIQAASSGVPGMDDNFYITKDQTEFVSKINGVGEITGMYMGVGEISHKDDSLFAFTMGYDPEEWLEKIFTVEVTEGRQLKKGETGRVVLGYNYQFEDKALDHGLEVGDKIEINGEQVEVVGFYEGVGNPQDDVNIYFTYEGFEEIYPEKTDKFAMVILKAEKGTEPSELAAKVEEKLRKHKGQKEGEEDFYVQTFEEIMAMFGGVINILNGILVLIALISLFVASVNITNTMYTSVLERTKEIGIMKSIGAKNRDIMILFVLESGLLGMLGGVIGVILGWLVARTGGQIATASGYAMLQPYFPWYLTIGCILFAFIIGTIAGVLPARQASKLKPVDALRYE